MLHKAKQPKQEGGVVIGTATGLRTSSRLLTRTKILIAFAAFVLIGGTLLTKSFASTSTVTTTTGVVTHGAITSNENTIGWLITCQPSHTLADDPIAHPGTAGVAHLHNFWGNASTNGNSTYATQEAASNLVVADTYNGATTKAGTSCDLGQFDPGTAGDTASYWAPVVYSNGKPVVPDTKAELYYRAKPTFGTGFKPIPQDARIIVGSHAATSVAANPALTDQHIYWECVGNSSGHYELPPTSCAHILLNVVYPSCYDNGPMDHVGPNGTDNQHFTYAVNGTCPAGFPQKIPQLSEKFKYTLPTTGTNIQLSADPMPGMPGMYGALSPTYTIHADFWNTWQPNALQYLTDKCINALISCGTNPITPTGGFVALPTPTPSPVPSPTPTPGALLGVPSSLLVSQATANSASISWGNVSTATGYKVYRNGALISSPAAPSYIDTGLKPSSSYTYTVGAFNASQTGDLSAPLTVTTLAAPITPPVVGGTGSSGACTSDQVIAINGSVKLYTSSNAPTCVTATSISHIDFYVDGNLAVSATAMPFKATIPAKYITNKDHVMTIKVYSAGGSTYEFRTKFHSLTEISNWAQYVQSGDGAFEAITAGFDLSK